MKPLTTLKALSPFSFPENRYHKIVNFHKICLVILSSYLSCLLDSKLYQQFDIRNKVILPALYVHAYTVTHIPLNLTPSDMRPCLISSITGSSSSISLKTSIRFPHVFGFTPLSVVTQSSSNALQQFLGELLMNNTK